MSGHALTDFVIHQKRSIFNTKQTSIRCLPEDQLPIMSIMI